MGSSRFFATTLFCFLATGCMVDNGRTLHIGIAQLRGLSADLYLTNPEFHFPLSPEDATATRDLMLTLRGLPGVTNPNGPEDCPMLDEAMQFSLGGQAPVRLFPGGYDSGNSDAWGGPIRTCYQFARMVFHPPLEGGRLPLVASSPDGEASMTVDIPPAYQPTIVDPQPSYGRGGTVQLQIPPDFLASVGVASLPIQEGNCVGAPLCFHANLYAHGGGFEQITGVASDGATLSVFVPTNTRLVLYDLYLFGRLGTVQPLSVDACTGYRYCDGITGTGILAPVTIMVR